MMATTYLPKKKSCQSESSTPSSPSPMAASYMHNNNLPQNGVVLTNGNAPVPTQNGQNGSESPSPGLNNNNAPKYGTPVPNRIFVGGISAQTTEGELAQLFSNYGNVKATKIIVDRAGVSKGYGFVTFETELEARRIMRESQCVVFKQRKLNIAPAIKKQPFSRSLEVQSPPISIPSAVLYANGSPYMFHNGMAFFSPPDPTPNFPLADISQTAAPGRKVPSRNPASQPVDEKYPPYHYSAATPANSQMATVPTPAAVCPTMMYPCPPGQPIYQYPYQHVPGHMYRGGHPSSMGYVLTTGPVMNQDSNGTPVPPPVLYYSMDGQILQFGDSPEMSMLYPFYPVPFGRTNEMDEGSDRSEVGTEQSSVMVCSTSNSSTLSGSSRERSYGMIDQLFRLNKTYRLHIDTDYIA